MNNLLNQKLKYLYKNTDKIKDYAGIIKNGVFRKCKKCLGKGIIEYIDGPSRLCDCVIKNLKKEVDGIGNGSDNS